ncbi:MAG TPA: O-antigen ligase family protein [Dongiaceae bacterium]|nr:O-antigen ligase family protein [Dongiaceae bacterium]
MPVPDRPYALPARRPTGPGQFTGAETVRARKVIFALTALLVSVVSGYVLVHFPVILLVGVLGMIAASALIVFRPFVGLIIYAFLFILQPGELFPILAALHLERVVGMLTLAGVALNMLRRHGQLMVDASAQTRWLWILAGAILLSVPFAFWRGQALNRFMDMMKIIGFYIMIVNLVDTRKRLRIFVWVYLVLMLYLGVSSMYEYFSGHFLFAQGIDRAVGLTSSGGGPNELGTSMAVTLPLFLMLMRGESARWGKLAALLGAGTCITAMVLTGSRASLLGCLAGLVVIWWGTRRRVLWAILGLLFLAAGFTLMPKQYKQRYDTVTQSHLDASSHYRIITWLTGLEMVADRPIFGVGAGCFGAARGMAYSNPMHKSYIESHSLYIQVLAELGLVGTFCFFSFANRFMSLNRRTARRLRGDVSRWRWETALIQALFTGFIVLFVSGTFGHNLFRRTWYVYAAMGLVVARLWEAERDDTHPEPHA